MLTCQSKTVHICRRGRISTVILKIHVYPFLAVKYFLDIILRYIVALCPYKFPLKTNKLSSGNNINSREEACIYVWRCDGSTGRLESTISTSVDIPDLLIAVLNVLSDIPNIVSSLHADCTGNSLQPTSTGNNQAHQIYPFNISLGLCLLKNSFQRPGPFYCDQSLLLLILRH